MSQLLNNTAKAIAALVCTKTEEFKLPAYVCVQDAKKRNAENIGSYSLDQQSAADALLAAVEDAYGRSRVFLNYRQRFVAVKVSAPVFADRVSLRAAKLDTWAEANGIVREYTRHGHLVYRATADALDNLLTVTAA